MQTCHGYQRKLHDTLTKKKEDTRNHLNVLINNHHDPKIALIASEVAHTSAIGNFVTLIETKIDNVISIGIWLLWQCGLSSKIKKAAVLSFLQSILNR
jgi:hypothetical protein